MRMIDADALKVRIEAWEYYGIFGKSYLIDIIDTAPTVEPPKLIAKIKTQEQAEQFRKAWESNNKDGLLLATEDVEIIPIVKSALWKWQTYTNGFGTFKELCCGECYHKRQQIDLNFCACCGAKMTNADELGGAT